MENRKRERGCERGESGVERKRWKKVESEKGKEGKKEKDKDKEKGFITICLQISRRNCPPEPL